MIASPVNGQLVSRTVLPRALGRRTSSISSESSEWREPDKIWSSVRRNGAIRVQGGRRDGHRRPGRFLSRTTSDRKQQWRSDDDRVTTQNAKRRNGGDLRLIWVLRRFAPHRAVARGLIKT
uniref:Uncharacterized protein n=1 Tax=Plectus sambesii TaxID=2011161 RepID=A0A914W9L0_9BILA